MAQEQHQYELDNEVEIKRRGVFDLSEKKEDAKPNQDQFIKSEEKKEENNPSIIHKVQRSNSNPSSGSFSEVDGEKKNKGLTEKIKEKITGEEKKERELEHQAAAHSEKKQEEEKSLMEKIKEKIPDTTHEKKNTTTDHEADFHKGEAAEKKGFMKRITGGEKKKEENGGDVTSPQEKNFMEKVKEMFPGADKKSTDGESAPAEHRPAEMDFHKDEALEKKGFMNKIKEKLPGEHKNNEVGEKLE